MKRFILLVLAIGICFNCSNIDDGDISLESTELNSQFIIDGVEYATPNGYIISTIYGANNRAHAIYLLNGVILNNEWHGERCDFSNDLTQGVYFNISSTSLTDLVAGVYKYEFNIIQPSIEAISFAPNIVVTDKCLTSSSDLINNPQITSGNMIVEKSGNFYTITYTFQTFDFGIVSGSYVGELQMVQDFS